MLHKVECVFSAGQAFSLEGEQRNWRIRNGRREGRVVGYLIWEKVYVYLKQ